MPDNDASQVTASQPISLRAESLEDLEVISACLQDGLTRINNMSYQPHKKRFAVGIVRFMWEKNPQTGAPDSQAEAGRRVQSGLHFDFVERVSTQNIDQQHKDGILPLLAISAQSGDMDSGDADTEITLTFAGGGAIRLGAECIDCHLQDLGESWPAKGRPDHDLETS